MIKSSTFYLLDGYILVTCDTTGTGGDADRDVAFKNCSDEHTDTQENIDIMMPMYNLIEHSNNCSDTSRTLWQFKRSELPRN